MIGYIQIYFKVIGEKEIYYASLDCDFGKPIGRYWLWKMKQMIKRTYEKFDNIYSVEFCTKEEFEENGSECNQIVISWGNDILGKDSANGER